ncbi:MAG: GFA family protein [Pseudomonadales bacterium]|nr:GFA family protein [Pseudomonadales bacterium]
MNPTYAGSCHCGAVEFTFEVDEFAAWQCNCSLCRRTGAIYHRVEATCFHLKEPLVELESYGSKPLISHKRCARCGVHTFSQVKFGHEIGALYCVNLLCVGDIETNKLSVEQFNGARDL